MLYAMSTAAVSGTTVDNCVSKSLPLLLVTLTKVLCSEVLGLPKHSLLVVGKEQTTYHQTRWTLLLSILALVSTYSPNRSAGFEQFRVPSQSLKQSQAPPGIQLTNNGMRVGKWG
ncbi:hypothetical protein E5288_WYG018077 [Bos mutus]|uniref:Uncharacterized protein n=1 Tax=Bos mutus TaxID=72004 RepID=A0A6B0RCK0_9CETA|nr:hypothetical protein [Bos mutus]